MSESCVSAVYLILTLEKSLDDVNWLLLLAEKIKLKQFIPAEHLVITSNVVKAAVEAQAKMAIHL